MKSDEGTSSQAQDRLQRKRTASSSLSTPDTAIAATALDRGERFADRLLIAAGIVVLILLAWQLTGAFTIMFGALVLATVLRALASQLERYAHVPGKWSVAASVLIIVILLIIGGWLIGDRVAEQMGKLAERLPAAIEAVTQWLNSHPLGLRILDFWETAKEREVPWSRLAAAAGLTAGALGNLGLMMVLGIYLAADPRLYQRGLIKLVPLRHRETVRGAMAASGEGLSRWLMGQGISMLFVGSSTAIGLALLGMPLALSLGLIAGLLGFIPFFGPIASGILAVLLAFTEGPRQALYVAGLCILIQQIEGDVLMPAVQRWAVALPPVLALVSVVIFGVLFGVMGVVFATPMMVMLMILVQKIYVEGVLGDKT